MNDMMWRAGAGVIAALAIMLSGPLAQAQQKSEVALSRQPGIFDMPSHVMEKQKLSEKRAAALGVTGLKIGWAFAWRTLIAAELVFGVSSGQGGLGWFIFENRNLLDIPAVFAGLLTVIIIGLIVENLIFRTIERNTVQKWGTQS